MRLFFIFLLSFFLASFGFSQNGISVSFSNPNNNQNFALNAPVGVTVDATDSNGNISNVRLFLNNTFVRQENGAPYEWGADNSSQIDAGLQNLAQGNYILRAVAIDNAGNTEETSISVSVGDPSNTNTNTSGISLSFSTPNNNQNFALNEPIGVTVDASDSNGSINNVRLFLNNTFIRQENGAPYEWGADNDNSADAALQNLAAGTYALRAVARDNAGNTEETSIQITIGGGGTTPTPPSVDLAFNFATAATNTPAGFIEDTGQAFGAKPGNLTYGWRLANNNAPVNATAEARNRLPNSDFDSIRESLIHMNRGGGMPQLRWELTVPNGTYQVTAQVGDANAEGTAATRHFLKAEGQTLIDYTPGVNGFGTRTIAQNITVSDGRLTLDALDGVNTKINSVAIQSVDGQRFPAVVGAIPLDGATDVNLNTSISANFLFLPNNSAAGATSLDNSTINTNTVRLFKINGNTATPVNVSVNGTGGGDAINVSVPSSTLDANSRYRFSVNGVKDLAGVTIFPYTSEFITGTAGGGGTNPGNTNLDNVSFTRTGNVAAGAYASLAVGPDGKLYGLQISGTIDRWNINADGTLSGKQELSGLTNAYGGNRLAVGLVFAPNATAGNLVAYVTHSTFVFTNGPEWDGKLSRLTGANLQNEQLILTDLPRSVRDHLTNSIVFDPNNNNVLYFNQGANNAGGAPDGAWGFREERLLSAATLRLDLSRLPNNLPLNVRTSENQAVINNANTNSATLSDGTYNPYFSNAPLTIYASGVRNAYDLVWHSNGQLYIPTNGTGGGSNSPASVNGTRRPNGASYNGPAIPAINNNSTQRDFLFRVNPNNPAGYYGHPNPKRGEYVLNRGRIDEGNYPDNISADANYRGFAFDFEFNKSPNGVIEYQSAGPLQGALIVCRFSGGSDLIALVPDGANGNIGTSKIGINGFTGFGDPLDLVEDTNTGNIYVSDFSTNQIVLIKPGNSVVNPPTTGNGITVTFGSPANNQNFAENAPVGVVVNASDSDGAINNVRLFLDNTFVRQEGGAPYEWGAANANSVDDALQNLAPGTYTLRAVATDNEGSMVETSIVITIGNPVNASGIALSFASPENNDVIGSGEQLGVVVSATDSDGTISNVRLFLDNNFIRQEGLAPYEWGAANTNTADAGLQNLAPGTYTLRAVATDNDGNTAESVISFSIINTTGGGNNGNDGNITVKNLRLIPGTDRAFPYDSRVVFHQVQNNREAGLLYSEYGEVQISNTGNQAIAVSSVNITSNDFTIISGGGAFTLAPGATRDVLIRFVTNEGAKRIIEAELQVNSNDPNTPQVSVTLAGGYMRQTQGGEEFSAKELVELYGFSTKLTGDGLLLDSAFPTPAQVASGEKGDIVASQFWEQADLNQPVSAIYTNVFKLPGGNEARLINAANQLVDGFRFSYRGEWSQTLFPNQTTNPASVGVSQFSGNVSEPFAIQINGQTTVGTNGTDANGNPNDIGVRVYKVIEADGTVRPNEYLAIMDFIPGGGCVESGVGLCDYNDNGIFITNIKPVDESRVSTRSAVQLAEALSVERSANQIRVYPNPTMGELFINVSKLSSDSNVKIMLSDVYGKVMIQKEVNRTEGDLLRLDISEFRNGMYFLTVQSGNKKLITKPVALIDTY